jgi:hypothetical protein
MYVLRPRNSRPAIFYGRGDMPHTPDISHAGSIVGAFCSLCSSGIPLMSGWLLFNLKRLGFKVAVIPPGFGSELEHGVIGIGDSPGIIHFVSLLPDHFF